MGGQRVVSVQACLTFSALLNPPVDILLSGKRFDSPLFPFFLLPALSFSRCPAGRGTWAEEECAHAVCQNSTGLLSRHRPKAIYGRPRNELSRLIPFQAAAPAHPSR